VSARLTGGRPLRILSLDGVGVYGYTSALWLRELCRRDSGFLERGSIDVFAGASSGAVNALLLAEEDDPRAAVVNGKIEDFWHQPGWFTNSSAVGNLLSYYGLAAWYGEEDFVELLHSAFGEKALGDLPHKVFVSCFDWHGGSQEPGSGWRPRFFNNFVPEWTGPGDPNPRVVDVAYAAAAQPGLRPMREGLGDGANVNVDPAGDAIAALIAHEHEQAPTQAPEGVGAGVLSHAVVLSIGDGVRQGGTWWHDGDLSHVAMGLLPVNPWSGAAFTVFARTTAGPAAERAELITGLLGDRYHRLNAPIVTVPPLVAAIAARWQLLRSRVFDHIETGVDDAGSQAALNEAVRFVTQCWNDRPASTASDESIAGHPPNGEISMADGQDAVRNLTRRVEELEAREEIRDFMHGWGRILDQVETAEELKDARTLALTMANDYMTDTGYFDFTDIPNWGGLWGFDQDDQNKQGRGLESEYIGTGEVARMFSDVFAPQIRWAYHLYTMPQVTVNLDEDEATFATTSEVVPLEFGAGPGLGGFDGFPSWLFLSQETTLHRVKGEWKVHIYRLYNLRQTNGSLAETVSRSSIVHRLAPDGPPSR
jgi:Patatin-like phospholipase/SnoaL-like domain